MIYPSTGIHAWIINLLAARSQKQLSPHRCSFPLHHLKHHSAPTAEDPPGAVHAHPCASCIGYVLSAALQRYLVCLDEILINLMWLMWCEETIRSRMMMRRRRRVTMMATITALFLHCIMIRMIKIIVTVTFTKISISSGLNSSKKWYCHAY